MESMYSIETLNAIEKKFKENKDKIFTPTEWKEPTYHVILEIIRQLKSWQDLKYCFKSEGDEDEQEIE